MYKKNKGNGEKMNVQTINYIGILVVLLVLIIAVVIITRVKNGRKINPTETQDITDLIRGLPTWSISDRKPSKLFHPNKDFIKVVLLSKITGMRSFWAEWDGIGLIKTQTRAYKVPKENVYGDVYIYDQDKKQSITELISVDQQDAEDSFHELMITNMAYTVGRTAGASDLLNKLGMVTVLLIVILLANIAVAYLVMTKTTELTHLIESLRPVAETAVQAVKP